MIHTDILLFYFIYYCTNIIIVLLYRKKTCVHTTMMSLKFKGYGYFLWLTIFCFYFTLTLIVILFYQNGFYYTHRIFLSFYLITHLRPRQKNINMIYLLDKLLLVISSIDHNSTLLTSRI